ncbi:hypothetical protein A7U60_g4011 [Sanghuangporus baumii]|uniref:Uncharacterized protein n=1 Tax=Sanghuangporus baumii TaxID=108892 RepID=A0A9Q5HZE6_SANBA|nr:hypothetical protein A7U60_g4011 [Sanghuangporus baumii]
MPSARLPPLPLVTGDRLLEEFSHRVLQHETTRDIQALIEQGRTALELAATIYLCSKRPMMAANEIPGFRSAILSDENFEAWVAHYGLRQQLQNDHLQGANIADTDDAKHTFQAYVGAVAVQAGVEVATDWTIELMRSQNTALAEVPADNCHRVESGRTEEDFDMEQGTRSQADIAQVKNFLEEVNKRCGQEHLRIEYQAENHASQHAPLWVVKCIVNGLVKGEGQGSSKRIAKEAAAKQAYDAMGWSA